MDYKISVTENAQREFESSVAYILFILKNKQAAQDLLLDFEETKELLSSNAVSLPLCQNIELANKGYRKSHFRRHRYIVLYRIVGNEVVVDAVFHTLRDPKNILK